MKKGELRIKSKRRLGMRTKTRPIVVKVMNMDDIAWGAEEGKEK